MSFANFAIEAGVNSVAKPAEPSGSDTKPAAPAADTTKTTPAPAADTVDADEVFGFDDAPDSETDDGDAGDDDGGAPAKVIPLGPPEGATEQQVEEWRTTHGIPETAEDYKAPAVDGITWNTQALAPILEAVHAHNVPQEAVADALTTYAQQIAEQQADLKRQDKDRLAEVRSRLTPAERSAIDAASSVMSRELRASIRQARLPDGRLLLHDPEFLRVIANLNHQPGGNTSKVAAAQNDAARERELKALMRSDFDQYARSGAADELSAIMRRRGAE